MTDDIHQVHIQSDFVADGVGIWISLHTGMDRRILRIHDGDLTWERVEPATNVPATLTLSDGHARALMSALLDHYHGTPDSHTQRADLMHERDRRDKLEDLLKFVVTNSFGPMPSPVVFGGGGSGLGGQGSAHGTSGSGRQQ